MLKKRKERYVLVQKDNLLAADAERMYFKNVKAYMSVDRPKPYDVRLLFPGKSDLEVANTLAEYFTRVSNEFEPLAPDDIPVTHGRKLPYLTPAEVSTRIKYFKKPKSMVHGDIFPSLMSKYADFSPSHLHPYITRSPLQRSGLVSGKKNT